MAAHVAASARGAEIQLQRGVGDLDELAICQSMHLTVFRRIRIIRIFLTFSTSSSYHLGFWTRGAFPFNISCFLTQLLYVLSCIGMAELPAATIKPPTLSSSAGMPVGRRHSVECLLRPQLPEQDLVVGIWRSSLGSPHCSVYRACPNC